MKQKKSIVHVERVEDIFSHEEIKEVIASQIATFHGDMALNKSSAVMIKLNLCLLKGPETGATVDPRVARALVELLLEKHQIEKIYLAEADATHLGSRMAFKILGWEDEFRDIPQVELFNLSEDETVSVPSRFIKNLKMSKTMMNVDLLVSLAKLKTHTQQKTTCILKNQFGAIPYKYKIVYHTMLAQAIYDATAARPPELSLVDGLISMEGNGPTNGVPRRTKLLLMSNDPVSMDHFCARLMGFRPMSIPNLKLAEKNGLGNIRYEVAGTPPSPVNLKFKFLPKWKELAKKGIGIMQRGTINEEA